MPRPKEINKDQIKLAISQHLALHGPRNWAELMAQHPGTSRPTFFRYIKEVREQMEATALSRGGAELRTVQKRIRSQTKTPAITEKKLKANLPAAPSPAMLVGIGDEIEEVFNFMAHFNGLVKDAEMMRAASVTALPDGGEKLKNPMYFDKAFGRRLELIETWLRTQDIIWNFERMRELYDAIIEEVGKADPDTQQAVLARIRTLNNKRGLTVNARLT